MADLISIEKGMFIFQNTSGGTYKCDEYGKPVTYLFPKGAIINMGGIELDISGLKVECYGGRFDAVTNEYFTGMVSRIPCVSSNIINTNIFINDNRISGTGNPGRSAFNQFKIEYLPTKELIRLQDSVAILPKGHPDRLKYAQIVQCLKQSTETGRNKIKHQLSSILNQNDIFPKCLSVIYDDRKLKHTTHIILEYKSKEECVLKIDNTISMAFLFSKKLIGQLKEKYNVDITAVNESFSSQKPSFIKFHSKDNSGKGDIELEVNCPVEQILFNKFYVRMTTILKNLGIPIQNIVIHSSSFNQKLTHEYIPFSIQNKLHFIEQKKYDGNESVFEKGARFRAEQALLSCLLDGKTRIPHCGEQDCKDMGFEYKLEEWYPNYTEVCNNLKKIISNLSLEALKSLYTAIDLDGCLSLAPTFKPFLMECMESKIDLGNYSVIATEVDKVKGEFYYKQLAPSLFFQKSTHTLFASVDYLSQVDRTNLDSALNEEFKP